MQRACAPTRASARAAPASFRATGASRLRRAAPRAAAAAAPATVDVVDWQGTPTGQATLSLMVPSERTAEAVVHRKLVQELANKRQGGASTKTRGEVRGGGKKPFAQKGTGRARQGSSRTPLKPGGGVAFGPKPRDFSLGMNKKEKRLAIAAALQNAACDTTVVEDFDGELADGPATKELAAALKRWGVDWEREHALLITDDASDNAMLSARNISRVVQRPANQLNVYDVLRAHKIVVTKSALGKIEAQYGASE